MAIVALGLLPATVLGGEVRAASAQGLQFTQVWSRMLPDTGHPVGLSSPNVATLDGRPAVVVGDRSGHVYAFFLDDGSAVPGWPYSTGGIPVDSTPSVAALSPGSADDTVFVGVGNAATPKQGGYVALNPDGTVRWSVTVKNPPSDSSPIYAVPASLAVGDLQGSIDVVAPSAGQELYAIDAGTGKVLPGFPWFSADSGFATPGLADLYGDGRTDIVAGGDQTAGMSYGVLYTGGGHLRVLAPTGNSGTASPTGGLRCEANPDSGVESSPAVGRFLAGGAPGIVVGTASVSSWRGAVTSGELLAYDVHCRPAWAARLGGLTGSSPALADITGGGGLEVVEGTNAGGGAGAVYALDGATGAVLWHQPTGEVIGSVTTADFGQGYQDVIVPSTQGAEVLDGRTGEVVATIEHGIGLQSSVLVTDDPDGTIGVTLAGYNGHNEGEVVHYEVTGSSGAAVDRPGAWPQFHHDPQLTGNADLATGAGAAPLRAPAKPCRPPAGGPYGYYEATASGAVYVYGNLARCGSLAGHELTSPVVAMAATAYGAGYWLATATSVHAFGDAGRFAAKGADGVVAMAATADGAGYWLVSRSGQVWAYGDARSYGGGKPATPVVGIAPSADGKGYWTVSSAGVVSGFGDARVSRAASGLAGTVGIATDRATGGYWLTSATGSVYNGGSSAYGSVPGRAAEHPVAGIAPAPFGTGYRLVDQGGELFCFGTATCVGSALTAHLHSPVVAIAAPAGS